MKTYDRIRIEINHLNKRIDKIVENQQFIKLSDATNLAYLSAFRDKLKEFCTLEILLSYSLDWVPDEREVIKKLRETIKFHETMQFGLSLMKKPWSTDISNAVGYGLVNALIWILDREDEIEDDESQRAFVWMKDYSSIKKEYCDISNELEDNLLEMMVSSAKDPIYKEMFKKTL